MNNQNNKNTNKKKEDSVFFKNTEILPIVSSRRSETSSKPSGTASRTQNTAARKTVASGTSSVRSAQRSPVRRVNGASAVQQNIDQSTVVFSKTSPGRSTPTAGSTASKRGVSAVPKPTKKPSEEEYFFTIDSIEDEKKRLKRMKKNKATNSMLSSLMKAVIYIVFILVTSGFISYFGISIGNDVFALVKDDSVINLTIGENETIDGIADLLSDNDVIKYPGIFKIYASLRKDSGKFVAGTYEVAYNMNYDTLLEVFKGPKVERKEVRITIPEGYTVDDIIDLFVNGYGMGTKEGFVDVIQNYDFDYWFVKELVDLPSDRKYRLEGYLYPDTYDFYTDWSEASIIANFLSNFNKKFDERYRAKCEELGMTVDEIVTLASIIQMEAKYDTEYELISSVFHNRMNNRYMTNGKLESDATIQYILPERSEDLTSADLQIDSRYNSYLYEGLPPGPITNPTTIAINYALFPAKTNYYFFVAQSNGYSLFASTNAEHERNKQIALGK